MTARELYIQIEDKLDEALAVCDVAMLAGGSESIVDSNSLERVMNIAVRNLREVIECCENATNNEEI